MPKYYSRQALFSQLYFMKQNVSAMYRNVSASIASSILQNLPSIFLFFQADPVYTDTNNTYKHQSRR